MTLADLLTERINETGFPFQEECYQFIKDTKNFVTKEYPYSFIGVDGSVDILTLKIPPLDDFGDSFWPIMSIECKKSKPGIKNWCFIKTDRGGYGTKPLFVVSIVSAESEAKLSFSSELYSFDRLKFFNDKMVTIDEVVNFGFESNILAESLNRNQEEKIYKSLLQSVSGITYVEKKKFPNIPELRLNEDKINGLSRRTLPPSYPTIIFIPIVLTTSDLYVANFNPNNVKDGEIDNGSVTWVQKNWVFYDFGLPDYLQQDELVYRGVFIVNNKHFPVFYNTLMPSF
ncbi:MAG: hypothetical protein WCT40_00280 [Candidatus Magasanikbacteria bacterium]